MSFERDDAPVLAVRRAGSGDPLVLIHGLGHHRQAWNPVFNTFADEFDVIAPDLAGFGESPGHAWGRRLTVDQACRDLEANFQRWGIEKPHVVGNSFGGAIALELAARGLVSSVTGLSPAGFVGTFDRLQTVGMLGVVRARSLMPLTVLHALSNTAAGRRFSGLGIYRHPERLSSDEVLTDLVSLKRTRAFERTLARNSFYRFTAPIQVPTTIAWGTHDRILPFGSAARAVHRIPGAHFVALPDCGHVPMPDNPAAVIEAVRHSIDRARDGVSVGAGNAAGQ